MIAHPQKTRSAYRHLQLSYTLCDSMDESLGLGLWFWFVPTYQEIRSITEGKAQDGMCLVGFKDSF